MLIERQNNVEYEDLIFKDEIFVKIEGLKEGSDEVIFHTKNGKKFHMYHAQDCCESVSIVEIIGDPDDLIGLPLMICEAASREAVEGEEVSESGTWTFYRFATIKGYLDIRWLGQSNGYYSERVAIEEIIE